MLAIMNFNGRRSGIDRRQFSYSSYIPERRSGNDQRNGIDRRTSKFISNDIEKRNR